MFPPFRILHQRIKESTSKHGFTDRDTKERRVKKGNRLPGGPR